MKVYIWNEPYSVRWGQSILIVFANSEAEARQKALSARHVQFSARPNDGEISIENLDEPSLVLDAPHAIAYEWSE